MFLIVVVTVLVLGIAFFQVIQGLYSALIMAILSVLCAVVALSFYETVGQMLYPNLPAHADAISLVALFVLPLLGLRLLADRFLGRNVVMGVWVDRVAGGVIGLVAGIVMMGILTLAVQMLPLGASVFGYQPFDDTLQRTQRLKPFCPDELTLDLAQTIAAGSLGGGQTLADRHDNLLLELYCARNQVAQRRKIDERNTVHERAGRVDTVPGAISVEGVHPLRALPDIAIGKLNDPLMNPETEPNAIVVRVRVDPSAREAIDNWWRLPATHFRLVTRRTGPGGGIRSHYPVAYLTGRIFVRKRGRSDDEPPPAPKWILHPAKIDDRGRAEVGDLAVQRQFTKDGPKKLAIDWVYLIGPGEVPEAMVFRRVAECPITDRQRLSTPPDINESLERIPPREKTKKRGGRRR